MRAEERNELIVMACGFLGVLVTMLGGIAYFFFQQIWQLVVSIIGIALMLFSLWASDE